MLSPSPRAAVGPPAPPVDASQPDATEPDAGPPGVSCDALVLDTSFPLAPGADPISIHPSAVFAGDGLWATVTVLEPGTSVFDVLLVHLGCDGTTAEPVLVSTTPPGSSDLDAAVTVTASGVVVVWQADVEGTIQLWSRLHDAETGEPLGDVQPIVTTRQGEPDTGTVWSPLFAGGEGPPTVVGERGVEAASAFQAFVQLLGDDGLPAGATLEPFFAEGVGQDGVVGVRTDAGLTLAWTRTPAEGETSVVVLPPGGEPTQVPTTGLATAGPTLAAFGSDVWLAASTGGGSRAIALHRVGDETTEELRQPGANDVAPALSPGAERMGLAWMRVVSGFRNDLFVRALTVEGESLTAGEVQEIPTTGDAYAYPIELVHVRDDVHLLVWTEGTSSTDLRAMGRFVRL